MNAPRIIPEAVLRLQIAASDPRAVGVGLGQCRLGQDPRAGAARDPPAARRRRPRKDSLHHLHQGRRRQHGEPRVRRRCGDGPRSTTPRSTRRSGGCPTLEPDPARRARARRLFAPALETPGGLKVQTIHAFCTRLLHQFPFEANVAARFEVLDESGRGASCWSETQPRRAARRGARPGQRRSAARWRPRSRSPPTAPSRRSSPRRSASATRCAPGSSTAGGVEQAVAELSRHARRRRRRHDRSVEHEIVGGAADPVSREWARSRGRWTQGSKSDQDQARAAHAPRWRRRRGARRAPICECSAPTSSSRAKTIVTRAIAENDPALADRLAEEQAARHAAASSGARPSPAATAPRRCSPSPTRSSRATRPRRTGAACSTTTT